MKQRTVSLLGLEFNNMTLQEAAKRILARPRAARFAYVVTPNADHIVRLWRVPALRVAYNHAMLCLLDSQFVSHCARGLGLATPPVVTGADLTAALLPKLDNSRVAIIGMDEAAFQALAARYPKIIFSHHQPPMGLLHDIPAFNRAQDFACEASAAFTFIALGSPVQELLAYSIALRREATGIGLCIGSALEFCAGTARRAPVWMRAKGLEWLHRLGQDPWRLAGRYLFTDPRILTGLVLAAIRQHTRP